MAGKGVKPTKPKAPAAKPVEAVPITNNVVQQQMQQTQQPGVHDERVRNLAYRKWEAAGCPESDGVCYWLEAERELTGN